MPRGGTRLSTWMLTRNRDGGVSAVTTACEHIGRGSHVGARGGVCRDASRPARLPYGARGTATRGATRTLWLRLYASLLLRRGRDVAGPCAAGAPADTRRLYPLRT